MPSGLSWGEVRSGGFLEGLPWKELVVWAGRETAQAGCRREHGGLTGAGSAILRGLGFVPGRRGGCCRSSSAGGGRGQICVWEARPAVAGGWLGQGWQGS